MHHTGQTTIMTNSKKLEIYVCETFSFYFEIIFITNVGHSKTAQIICFIFYTYKNKSTFMWMLKWERKLFWKSDKI